MLKIEHNIPIPPKNENRLYKYKYPFGSMEVGDSFLIKTGLTAKKRNTRRSSMNHSLKKYNKQYSPITITTRIDGENIRVWRTK